MEHTIHNIAELDIFSRELLNTLAPHPDSATVVGLSGDLGAGKTAFVRSLARALGVTEPVQSPTFVIAKFYDLQHSAWKRLIHVDAYRIEDPSELNALRWDELLRDPKNLVMVEWPEKITARFPHNASRLAFIFVDETTRTITS